MARILIVLALIGLLLPVTWIQGEAPPKNKSQRISIEALPMNPDELDQTEFGELEFLGAWRLTSDNNSFGGFSAMALLPDDRLLLVSDLGIMAGFGLDDDTAEAVRPFIAPLPGGPVPPNEFASKNWDAESMHYDPDTKQFWIGFEHEHGIWRYAPSFARVEASRQPKEMRKWPQNGGAEAMLKLPGGRWAVFSENAEAGEGLTEALLFSGDPAEDKSQIQKFSYRPPDGFALTDAAMMPDGRAIMLHRRFRPLEGVRAIVSIADPAQIAPGKIFSSRQLARFEPPLTVDNMEAVAVQEQDGEIIIWMASDDNFNPVQQSILLKFALIEPKPDASTQEKTGPEGPGFESLKE